MNIRFAPAEIRFRISMEELTRLMEQKNLREQVAVESGRGFTFGLRLDDAALASPQWSPDSFSMALSAEELEELQSKVEKKVSPKELGIERTLPSGTRLLLEVDAFTLRKRKE